MPVTAPPECPFRIAQTLHFDQVADTSGMLRTSNIPLRRGKTNERGRQLKRPRLCQRYLNSPCTRLVQEHHSQNPNADDKRLNLQTAHLPIRHTRGWMARLSNAPVLILTAGDTDAGSIAMGVWTQPPSADAGVAVNDIAAERTTTPSNAAESHFIATSTSQAIGVNGDFTSNCVIIGPHGASTAFPAAHNSLDSAPKKCGPLMGQQRRFDQAPLTSGLGPMSRHSACSSGCREKLPPTAKRSRCRPFFVHPHLQVAVGISERRD